jgi:hypothetical protein
MEKILFGILPFKKFQSQRKTAQNIVKVAVIYFDKRNALRYHSCIGQQSPNGSQGEPV